MATILSYAPALLGVMIVIQAGINRKIAAHWGLPAATLLNGLILAMAAGVFFAIASLRGPGMPAEFRVHLDPKAFSSWFLLPGLIGFALVVGGPWAVARWGAVHTFTFLISAQLAMSLFWDWRIEGLSISRQRWIGVAVTWLGVVLASRGR